MNIRRLAGLAAASPLLALAGSAEAGDPILAVTGVMAGGEMNLTLAEIGALDSAGKGPLFIVFPYDGVEEVSHALFHSRSANPQHRDRMTAGSDIAS